MSQRPIVALVCDAIYPYSHGGREFRYQQLFPWLVEHAEIHVYTMHWWDGPATYTDRGITYHAISRLLPLYKNNRRSILQGVRFGLASLRLLGHHFDVLEADHIPYFQVFALRLVSAIKRKPFIVTWHEVWSRSYWREYLGWTGTAAWSMEWLAMRLPDHIIAASPQTAERLQRILGSRKSITTAPNGIDLDTVRDVCAEAEISDIVVVGRLISHKCIGVLLDVMAVLHGRGIPVTCRVIGDGPEREALRERAETLRLSHAVEFRHDVREQKDLYALIKAAKVFVSLSTREGFGIAVLEAIACGVPVLTTSAPDNFAQYLAARYSRGTVCEPTPEAIAAALQDLLDKAAGYPTDQYAPDHWVAEYDWSAMADRLASVYRR
jgi:glycosyltransferase involved in cell wall biosynthesis